MSNFSKKISIKVYGDIMLDQWIIGKYAKKSQEAPIKIFSEKDHKYNLGGVGNLIMNLKNLNIKLKLFSYIGKDLTGKKIEKLLKKNNFIYKLKKTSQPTTIKTRFVNNYYKHYFRSDLEKATNLNKNENFFIKKLLLNDFVAISDYAKGSIKKNTVEKILKRKCKVFVDPKNPPNYFKNVFLVKPNMKKFNEWFGKFTKKKAVTAMKKMNWEWLVITDGKKGVHVFKKDGTNTLFKANKVTNPDVAGAGDIFFSVLIYSYIQGYDIFTASCLANNASSKLVAKKGVQIVQKKDLKSNIIFANGVFDTFHEGHKKLLSFAKNLGKKLIVGINSDKSVSILKGKDRPRDKLKKRIDNLKKTKLISKIIVFSYKTPLKLIKNIKPDLIVKGGDYKFSSVVGKNFSNIVIFPRIKNFSSSKIIKKII